ncbi:MAG TPA: MtrB/PioB family outer membrane beta-barrel protein [Rhodocyclaceae bacterium]
MAKIKTSMGSRTAARPRTKALAACIGAVLAQWAAGPAHADSAVGVDTALGNALNPPGRSAMPRPIAADGFDTVRHSPSGQLYGLPMDVSAETTKTEGGWEYAGGMDVGALGGGANKKNALFRKYKDLKNGAYLDYFEVEGDKTDSAAYAQAFGGGLGQHDQFYGFQFGHYNEWRLRLFYNETQHVYTDTWKSLYSGEGSGNLRTGLPAPRMVTTGTSSFAPAVACTAAAPCWSYGGKTYGNAQALASINGMIGTPNATTGTVLAPLTGTAAATGAVQSNMAAAINAKLAATDYSELAVVRKKGGARLDANIDNFWKGYVSYNQEKRKGARPFAMNEGNVSTEIAEPIDYTTHELLAGVGYVDGPTQANIRATLSMFRNNIDTLNVQHFMLNSPLPFGAIQTATYALNPDNNAFNLKGEFARDLPEFYKGRFTAAASWGTNRQDETLLPPISPAQNADLMAAVPGGLATFGGTTTNVGYANGTALVSNWNTPAALSQQTAKQRIDNKLLDLGFSMKPLDDLNVKASFRTFETVNKGGYTAYNPLTGQFGRGVADGNNANMDVVVGLAPGATPLALGSCYIPPGYPAVNACRFGLVAANGANIPVFGQARSTKQTNYGLAGDYDLTRSSSVNAAWEREVFQRNFRERDKTWEDKFKLGYVDRALENATLRLSAESDRKRGGDYRYRTFEDLGTGLPGLTPQQQIAALTAGTAGYAALNANLFNRYSYYFRKYDQADRDQNILNARLNYLLREDMDMGLMLQSKTAKYPNSLLGLTKDDLYSATVEFNYQPISGETLYAFYSYQQGKKRQNLNSGTGVASCTLANIALYGYVACSDGVNGVGSRPGTANWTSTNDDRNDVFGLGFQQDMGNMKLGVDYSYSASTTRIDYSFGSTALNAVAANQAAVAAIAGTVLPNMTYQQHTLSLNLLIPVDKKLSLRLFDRLEIGRVKDWHYDGVLTNVMAAYDSGTLLLDSGPQNYRANVIGVFLQYKL